MAIFMDHTVVGLRVQMHPATDLWMQGDRYGEIVKVGRKLYSVKLDKSGRTVKVLGRDILRIA